MMTTIRTIYNVYLVTTNEANAQAAKATLQQLIHAVFRRMEDRVKKKIDFKKKKN